MVYLNVVHFDLHSKNTPMLLFTVYKVMKMMTSDLWYWLEVNFNLVDLYSLSTAPFLKLVHAFCAVMCLEKKIVVFLCMESVKSSSAWFVCCTVVYFVQRHMNLWLFMLYLSFRVVHLGWGWYYRERSQAGWPPGLCSQDLLLGRRPALRPSPPLAMRA